jgi:hypothetical protein
MADINNPVFNWIGYFHCLGLTIEEKNGNLHVKPTNLITPYASDLIKRRKVEIVDAFHAVKETREERSAIIQFDGGLSKDMADKIAHNDIMKG